MNKNVQVTSKQILFLFRDISIYGMLFLQELIYMPTFIYTQRAIYTIALRTRSALCHALLQEHPGKRVALLETRRRAGVAGQTPSRGSSRPGRFMGRPDQELLPKRNLLPILPMPNPAVCFERESGLSYWSPSAKSGCPCKLTMQS